MIILQITKGKKASIIFLLSLNMNITVNILSYDVSVLHRFYDLDSGKRADNYMFWDECPSGPNSGFLEPILLQRTHFPERARIKSVTKIQPKKRVKSPFLFLCTSQITFMAIGEENTFSYSSSVLCWGPCKVDGQKAD